MNEEIKIIKKLLPEMAGILNAVPGERFESKSAETLLIVKRRMEASDLQREISVYTHLFSKDGVPNVTDLSNAAVAFVKIKTLCEIEKLNFDAISIRELIKEFNTQKTKVLNIIHLSKVNALTAEDYQKEVIKKTLDKSEKYLSAFEEEIRKAEKKIEKESDDVVADGKEETKEVKETDDLKQGHRISLDVIGKIYETIWKSRNTKEVQENLKKEESKLADSRCEEIPYYESSLKYTEKYICKDIPKFSVFLRKGNTYFGKTENAGIGTYDNKDQSLLELMNVNKDFIQFLTTDLLSGEYELEPFSESEKEAMQLYFNFICMCFEKHIGKELSVQEYLHFKDYYNRLVLTMLELEEKERSNYYRALALADMYVGYMKSYELTVSDDKEDVIKNIILGRNLNYIGDLELILENHVVSDKAKDELLKLSENIRYFIKEEASEDIYKEPPADFKGAKIVIEVLDNEGKLMDEALFMSKNVEIAVSDYLKKDVPMKRIGIEKDGVRTYFYTGKKGAMSIPNISSKDRASWTSEQKEYFESIEQEFNKTMIKIGGYTI